MAPIQLTALCHGRKHAELVFLIQNTNDKVFFGHHEPGLGKESVPKTPRRLVFILPMRIFSSILQSNKQRHGFP